MVVGKISSFFHLDAIYFLSIFTDALKIFDFGREMAKMPDARLLSFFGVHELLFFKNLGARFV